MRVQLIDQRVEKALAQAIASLDADEAEMSRGEPPYSCAECGAYLYSETDEQRHANGIHEV
jgi:hypothetical protein